MNRIYFHFTVLFLLISLCAYSQKSRYRKEYDNNILTGLGFVKENTLDLPGFIINSSYLYRIGEKVDIAYSIAYSNCRSEESGSLKSVNIFNGSFSCYLGRNLNRQLRISFGLGGIINKYLWHFQTDPNATLIFLKNNKLYEINENSVLDISDKPGFGYNISFLVKYRISPRIILTFQPLLQNDTNGNALFMAGAGAGYAF